jgi:hypothetical protein
MCARNGGADSADAMPSDDDVEIKTSVTTPQGAIFQILD